jgi:hypothetical protein
MSMVTYPGELEGEHVLRSKANPSSNIRGRIHHHGVRNRNGLEIHKVRTVRTSRQMEYDNLHRGGVVSTLVDMDANNRLANVQSMLW